MEINSRLALVTGGSSGIGAATARALAHRGASIILLGRNRDRLAAVAHSIHAAGGRAETHAANLADPADVTRVAGFVRDRHGSPDILINNAGAGRWRSITDTTAEELAAPYAVPVSRLNPPTRCPAM